MPKHQRTSVVHNLMLREIHGCTARGNYCDFDERILKQVHKSRAVNGPDEFLQTSNSSRKDRAHRKFPGKIKTNGLHLQLSTQKRVWFESNRVLFTDATTPQGTSVCVAAEVGPLGHLEYCHSFAGDKGFGKTHDVIDMPQTPAVTKSYEEIRGPMLKWETCIYRVATNPTKPLQIISAEDGTLLHEFAAPEGTDESRIFFSSIDCRDDGLTFLEVMTSRLSSNVAYDVFAVYYPPAKIAFRLQVMASLKKNKMKMKKFNVSNDYLIGEGLNDEVMFFDLKKLMKEDAVFYPTGEAQDPWQVPTYKVFDVQLKPVFQTKSSRCFVLFNPWELPAYYIIREGEISFVVCKLPSHGSPAEDSRLGVITPVNIRDGSDPPPPQFLYSIEEPRILFIDHHILHLYTVTTDEHGEHLRRIHTRDFCADEIENSRLRAFAQDSGGRLNSKKMDNYIENCTLNWNQNMFLKQIAVVKYTDTSVTCYVLDAFDLSQLYYIEPRCFTPLPGIHMAVEFECNQIIVSSKLDSSRTYFIFNLFGECDQRERDSFRLPSPPASDKKPLKRIPPHLHQRPRRKKEDSDEEFRPSNSRAQRQRSGARRSGRTSANTVNTASSDDDDE